MKDIFQGPYKHIAFDLSELRSFKYLYGPAVSRVKRRRNIEIREMRESGKKFTEIAKIYGISIETARKIHQKQMRLKYVYDTANPQFKRESIRAIGNIAKTLIENMETPSGG